MKEIYYVVEKELIDIDGVEETTGNKTISVYTIEDNKLVKFFDLETTNDVNTETSIDDYLIDNGYGDTEIKKIRL